MAGLFGSKGKGKVKKLIKKAQAAGKPPKKGPSNLTSRFAGNKRKRQPRSF